MKTTPLVSASAFRAPDPKKQVGFRLRQSTLTKIKAVVEKWRAQAAALSSDTRAIDMTYVIELLLARGAEHELAGPRRAAK